jgi:hypothetical protein
MDKQSIIIPLGIKILRNDSTLTAKDARVRMVEFFRGCRTIADMKFRIRINGGSDMVAEAIAKDPTFAWLWTTEGGV